MCVHPKNLSISLVTGNHHFKRFRFCMVHRADYGGAPPRDWELCGKEGSWFEPILKLAEAT